MDIHTQMNKSKNKKRFSDKQIKSLELIFNSESRPESQAKQQIADQLGLKPQQVAIWFQNRRARSKLKQVEHEYRSLKASYDNLATRFQSLKREHHYLISEMQRLKGSQNRPQQNEFSFTTKSFGGEESKTHPHDAYARGIDELQAERRNQGSRKFEQETEALNMAETFSGLPLSCGYRYSVESALEPDYLPDAKPDYLPDAKCGSQWWESY